MLPKRNIQPMLVVAAILFFAAVWQHIHVARHMNAITKTVTKQKAEF
jgi:hypothetical protein